MCVFYLNIFFDENSNCYFFLFSSHKTINYPKYFTLHIKTWQVHHRLFVGTILCLLERSLLLHNSEIYASNFGVNVISDDIDQTSLCSQKTRRRWANKTTTTYEAEGFNLLASCWLLMVGMPDCCGHNVSEIFVIRFPVIGFPRTGWKTDFDLTKQISVILGKNVS